jgi:hypothetical protein
MQRNLDANNLADWRLLGITNSKRVKLGGNLKGMERTPGKHASK